MPVRATLDLTYVSEMHLSLYTIAGSALIAFVLYVLTDKQVKGFVKGERSLEVRGESENQCHDWQERLKKSGLIGS